MEKIEGAVCDHSFHMRSLKQSSVLYLFQNQLRASRSRLSVFTNAGLFFKSRPPGTLAQRMQIRHQRFQFSALPGKTFHDRR
jgi:hypothetical protein